MYRHMNSHAAGDITRHRVPRASLDHDDPYCKYCGKERRSKQSLIQHEIRCQQNPDRYDYMKLADFSMANLKGATLETSGIIQKQQDTMNRMKSQGWKHVVTPHVTSHVHLNHNQEEIAKWVNYVSTIDIDKSNYTTYPAGKYIAVRNSELTKQYNQDKGTVTILLEHVHLMRLVLGDCFQPENVVHHIDQNPSNNDVVNLMVFNTKKDHSRFHSSDAAYLIYDGCTHRFQCISK